MIRIDARISLVKWMGDWQSILIGHVQGPPECFDDTSKGGDIANGLGI